MNYKLILLCIWACVQAIYGQCFTETQISTTTRGKYWEEDEIDLLEILESMLNFIKLTREQLWLVDGNLIISQSGDVSCALLGKGIDLEELDIQLRMNWNLPVMTSALVVGNKIMVSSKGKSIMVSKVQFTHLAQLLGINDRIDVSLDPHVVFLVQGTERILTNFRVNDRNSCPMEPTSKNIQHSLNRIISDLELTWDRLNKALELYGEEQILSQFATCLDTENLSLHFLLLIETQNYEFCIRGLFMKLRPEIKLREKRDIGLGSLLFGNGKELMNLEQDLKMAIDSFNGNFKSLETFDNGLIDNIQHLQDSVTAIDGNENLMQDTLIELQMQVFRDNQHLNFLLIKTQQITALGDILHHSLIHEQLEILERALFRKNICNFSFCELSITAEVNDGIVIIHRQMLTLAASNLLHVTCEAVSRTQVPTLHGVFATETLDNKLIHAGTIYSHSDLRNSSLVNQKLRLLKEDELLLSVFHTFSKYQLQCLQTLEFTLNGQIIACTDLQKFQLEKNFTLTYENEKLSAKVLISHTKKLSKTWLDQYTFGNLPASFLPLETPDENFLPEVIHQVVFTEAGNVNVQTVSLFTSGTILFVLCSCAASCYRCKGYRTCWKIWVESVAKRIYNCATTEGFRLKKENIKIKKEIETKKENIRQNLEDLRLYKEAIGPKHLPPTSMENQPGTVTISPERRGVRWQRDTSEEQGLHGTTLVEINQDA